MKTLPKPQPVNQAIAKESIEPGLRNPMTYDAKAVGRNNGLACKDETRTQQQFLEESNINYIAEKFMRTGIVAQVPFMPTGGDFEGIFDFQSAMNTINLAKNEFMELPAKIRSRFENDPGKLIEFLSDEENRYEAEKLGLVEKRPAATEPVGGAAAPTPTDAGTKKPEPKPAPTGGRKDKAAGGDE